MLIITCPCNHEWVVSTRTGVNWAHALQADPCPACGRDAGGRIGNTVTDPSINEVLGSLPGCKLQPGSLLSWHIMAQSNQDLVLVMMHLAGQGGQVELIGEVSRKRDKITKSWFARVTPIKTAMQRLPENALSGYVADLMLSIGMGEKPVMDWQAFAEKATVVFRGKEEPT